MLRWRHVLALAGCVPAMLLPARAPAQNVSLVAVGDVMMARGVDTRCRKSGWDYPFHAVAKTLHSADLAFGNLECPVSSRGGRMSRIITFRADPVCLPALHRAGFSLLSIANNHTMDYGRTALADTIAGLKQQAILPVGGGNTYAEATQGVVVTKNGLRIGFLGFSAFPDVAGAFAPDQPSIAVLSDERVAACVRALKQRCDLVVVSCHWGIEGRPHPISMQIHLAHVAIDAGAALVLGHHPHVPQDIERYHNGVIVYSLGNFVFDSGSRGGNAGILFRCTLSRKGVLHYSSQQVAIKACQPTLVTPAPKG